MAGIEHSGNNHKNTNVLCTVILLAFCLILYSNIKVLCIKTAVGEKILRILGCNDVGS